MNLHRHWDMVFCIVFVFPKLKYFYTRFPYKSVVEEMKKKKVMDLLKRAYTDDTKIELSNQSDVREVKSKVNSKLHKSIVIMCLSGILIWTCLNINIIFLLLI